MTPRNVVRALIAGPVGKLDLAIHPVSSGPPRGIALIAHPHPKQGSAILSSLVGCNALVELPAESTEILPNTKVPAILLEAV